MAESYFDAERVLQAASPVERAMAEALRNHFGGNFEGPLWADEAVLVARDLLEIMHRYRECLGIVDNG
jgi:hypothetical protein